MLDHYGIVVWVSPNGTAEGASVTSYWDDGTKYRVEPLFGPFDTWEDLLQAIRRGLDIYPTLMQ